MTALAIRGDATRLPLRDANMASDLVKWAQNAAPAVRQHPGARPTPTRRRRHGACYLVGRRLLDPLTNWWSKVDQRGPDECWPWKRSRDKDGYGRFAVGLGGHKQLHVRAHRFGYEQLVGPIPNGHVVCHRCDNPPCCNPRHWFTGTPLDNNDDKVAKDRHAKVWGTPLNRSRQTHCKRGHAFIQENTLMVNGCRICRECGRAASRRFYAEHGPAPRPTIICVDCGRSRPHKAHDRCGMCDRRWRRKGSVVGR